MLVSMSVLMSIDMFLMGMMYDVYGCLLSDILNRRWQRSRSVYDSGTGSMWGKPHSTFDSATELFLFNWLNLFKRYTITPMHLLLNP